MCGHQVQLLIGILSSACMNTDDYDYDYDYDIAAVSLSFLL